MAVYSWIYANAKMEGNRKDYHVRLCSPQLDGYREKLMRLSNRLLSTDRRYGEAERQNCWFAGYIDDKKEKYLVAVGGDQETILEMPLAGGGFRAQHCVLGYCFTGEDIHLYKKDTAIFEPLKEVMRQIQRTGRDKDIERTYTVKEDFSAYVETLSESVPKGTKNIMKSTVAVDHNLWKQSLQRPVMTGIVSADDAKKLLSLFPDGVVSVMEDVELQYNPGQTGERIHHDARQSGTDDLEEKRKQDIKALELETEAKRRKLEEMRAERIRKQNNRSGILLLVILFAFVIFILFVWFVFMRKMSQ